MPDGTEPQLAVLGDRYELQKLIGRGGMAEVYRAHDRVLRREVAVKLMSARATSATERSRFTGEAHTLARMNHRSLVTILDAATSDDRPYLVMELVRGPSLAERCRGGRMDPGEVAGVGAQVADALTYVHGRGVVHRDLKPGNVLLAEDGRALLADFGVARLLSDTARHTATGMTIGTAAYLAPEQVRGEDVTPAADVYSLGLVLLEALTGERAYGGSPTEAALARLTTPPQVPAELPQGWRDLLGAMTATEPDDRPDTGYVATRLADLAAGTPGDDATTPVPTAPEPTRRIPSAPTVPPSGTSRWHWWVLAAALVVVIVLAGVLVLSPGGGQDGATTPPADVPPELAQPLQELHDAVEGER